MDILAYIANSEERDIIISLPLDKTWLEYLSYFIQLKSKHDTLDVVVESVPKTTSGNKCFIVYDGTLRGYMFINRLTESEDNEVIVELLPYLNSVAHKAYIGEIDGDGYKYYYDNSNTQ